MIPKSVIKIVGAASKKFPDSIDDALGYAAPRVRKLPEYAKLVDDLVNNCLRGLIADKRHSDNIAMREEAYAERRPKVSMASGAVNEAFEAYGYYINAKKTLGSVTGGELDGLIKAESAKATTHCFNVSLLSWLKDQKIPKDRTVREAIPARRLNQVFEHLLKQAKGGETSAEAGG